MLNEDFMIPEVITKWEPRLPLELAMGEDPQALIERYNLTPSQFQSLILTPAFLKEVDRHRHDIVENGVTFRLKAKIQAEEYLQNLDTLIHDMDTSPAVRLDAIKSVVKWAGYEPKENTTASTGGTRLVIQWGDGSGQVALETT